MTEVGKARPRSTDQRDDLDMMREMARARATPASVEGGKAPPAPPAPQAPPRRGPRVHIEKNVVFPRSATEPIWDILTSDDRTISASQPGSGRMTVRAAPLKHGVRCFGYVIEEEARPGTFLVEKAKARGLKPGREYKILQSGEKVKSPLGTPAMTELIVTVSVCA
jgi:hypothetical protein